MLQRFFGFETSVKAKSAEVANQKQELEKLLEEAEEHSRNASSVHANAQDNWDGTGVSAYNLRAGNLKDHLSFTTEEIRKYSAAVSHFYEKIESVERGFKDLCAEAVAAGFQMFGTFVLGWMPGSPMDPARLAKLKVLIGKHDALRVAEVEAHVEFAEECGVKRIDEPLIAMFKALFPPPLQGNSLPELGLSGVKDVKWVLDRLKDGYDIKTIQNISKHAEFSLAKGEVWKPTGKFFEKLLLRKRGRHVRFPTTPKQVGSSLLSRPIGPTEQFKGAADSKYWKPLEGASEELTKKGKKALDFGGKVGKGLTAVKYTIAFGDSINSGTKQWQADSHDPSLNGAAKVARTAAKVGWDVVPGLAGGSAGTAAGAAVGTAICPGVGTVIGGVVGGYVGGSMADGGKNHLDSKVTHLIGRIGK